MGWDKDIWVAIISGVCLIVVAVISLVAKTQSNRIKDHEERLAKLEPAFGDSLGHIRDLRGHINRGDPPPPPPLPGSLVHYYYD